MKAAIWTAYGPPEVLEIGDVARPIPRADELLVKVEAANVFPGDCELRRFDIHPFFWLPLRVMSGIRRPRRIRILGQEFAGTVEAVGSRVTGHRIGERVFAPTALGGAYAEYVCVGERLATSIPSNVSFEEAACVSVGGSNALHFLRLGGVGPGTKVLLYGAGGSIGTLAVQLACRMGAEVTAVEDGTKLAALRELGAHHVIDYQREDFTRNGERYDVIVDIPGKSPFRRSLGALVADGRYVLGNASAFAMLRSLAHRRVKIAFAGYVPADLGYLRDRLAANDIRAVIDRRFPLDQVVAAHHYVESGRKIGNVVLSMAQGAS